MDYPDVKFWQYFSGESPFDNNPEYTKDVCFANLEGSAIKVKFDCEVDASLDNCHVIFWIGFLKLILDNKYTYKTNKNKAGKINSVIWEINSKSLGYHRTLLYLTAQRYLQEFPEIILELYKYRKMNINELFDKFIDIHIKCASEEIELRHDTFFGHALCSPYDYKAYIPIKLEKFKKHLQHKFSSVNRYFNNLDN